MGRLGGSHERAPRSYFIFLFSFGIVTSLCCSYAYMLSVLSIQPFPMPLSSLQHIDTLLHATHTCIIAHSIAAVPNSRRSMYLYYYRPPVLHISIHADLPSLSSSLRSSRSKRSSRYQLSCQHASGHAGLRPSPSHAPHRRTKV